MKGLITNMWSNKSSIYISLRDQDLNRKIIKIIGFKPYFYIPSINGKYTSIYGDKLKKIVLSNHESVYRVRKSIIENEKPYDGCKNWVHHEADIPYTRKFMIDKKIKYAIEIPDKKIIHHDEITPCESDIKPRIWLMDIEVMPGHGFPDPEKVPRDVNAVTIRDSYTNKYITLALKHDYKNKIIDYGFTRAYIFNNKYDLGYFFTKLYKKYTPDIIGGYNVNFDVDYMFNWLNKIGISIKFKGDRFDYYHGYKVIHQNQGLKLKNLAIHEGYINPDQYILASNLKDIYENDFDKFIWYNWQDVDLLRMMDDDQDIFGFFWNMKTFLGMESLESLYYLTPRVDKIVLDICKKRNVIAPSGGVRPVQPIKGAEPMKPPQGVFNDIASFDFTAYYPSIILTFGLSPENKIDPDPDKVVFRKDRKGIMVEVIENVLEQRYEIEKAMEKYEPGSHEHEILEKKRYIVKILSTALWGYISYAKSRFCDYHVPNLITGKAREGIDLLEKIATKKEYKVIYKHTDSIYIQCPEKDAPDLNDEFNIELKNYFMKKYDIDNYKIHLKYEEYNKHILFLGTKNRYASRVTWKKGQNCDFLEIKGLEAIKSNQSKFTKRKQKEIINKMLYDNISHDDAIQWLKDTFIEFQQEEIQDIALIQNIKKPFDEYKSKPPVVRGAILANMYLDADIESGYTVYYLYVKSVEGLPTTDVISFDDIRILKDKKIEIDWMRMFDVEIIQKIKIIMESYGVKMNDFDMSVSDNKLKIKRELKIEDFGG